LSASCAQRQKGPQPDPLLIGALHGKRRAAEMQDCKAGQSCICPRWSVR